jgi:hypothetical protein
MAFRTPPARPAADVAVEHAAALYHSVFRQHSRNSGAYSVTQSCKRLFYGNVQNPRNGKIDRECAQPSRGGSEAGDFVPDGRKHYLVDKVQCIERAPRKGNESKVGGRIAIQLGYRTGRTNTEIRRTPC